MKIRQLTTIIGIGVVTVIFTGAGFGVFAPPQLDNPYLQRDFSQGLALHAAVGNHHAARLAHSDFSTIAPDVNRFYTRTGYALAWLEGPAPSQRAQELIAALADVKRVGLNPDNYDAALLSAWVKDWKPAPPSAQNQAERTDFDLALTVAGLRFARDLRFGRLNPGTYDVGATLRKDLELADLFRQSVLDADVLADGIHQLEPPYAEYQRTIAALSSYREIARNTEGLALPPRVTEILKPGDHYEGTRELAALLIATGDLNPRDLLPQIELLANGIYTQALADGVQHFQARHGLAIDGQIGPATIAALRVPMSDRVRQLELALERWRWLPHDFARAPVVVNIPEFKLRAMGDTSLDRTAWETRVVVGSAPRHETPGFGDQMEYLVFSPYWNVTTNITRNEIVPHILADPSYLTKNRYEVVNWNGEFVADANVTDAMIADLRAGRLAVRQKPGAGNSLGGVKFIFPNAQNIYLHDTPSKHLFAAQERDFSHGCIRVEHPEELAQWVLASDNAPASTPNDGWTPMEIQNAMHRSSQKIAKLATPIPVLLIYQTAQVTADGVTQFFNDIYGRDQELEVQLASLI